MALNDDFFLEVLNHVENLISTGKFKEAQTLVVRMKEDSSLSEPDVSLITLLLTIKIALELGQYERTLELIQNYWDGVNENPDDTNFQILVFLHLAKAESLLQIGRLKEVELELNETEEILMGYMSWMATNPTFLTKWQAKFHYLKGRLFWRKGSHDEALEEYHRSLALYEKVRDKNGMAFVIKDIGNVYREKGEHPLAHAYYNRSLQFFEELGNKKNIGALHNNLGILYWEQGYLTKALEAYERCLQEWKEVNYEVGIARVLNNLGVLYSDMGSFNLALDYLEQGLIAWKTLKNQQEVARVLNNMGIIYKIRGELDAALSHQMQCLHIRETLGNEQALADVYHEIGRIHHLLSKLEKARDYYLKALEIRVNIGNYTDLSSSLLWLIVLAIEMGEFNETRKHLEHIKEISRDVVQENSRLLLHARLAEAYVLKHRKRLFEKAKALEMFQSVIEEENIIDKELIIFAIFNYCDLLLYELEKTENEEILSELKDWIKRLKHVASLEPSYLWLTETYILEARLCLVEQDQERAIEILKQADDLARQQHISYLGKRISNIIDEILLQVEKLDHSADYSRLPLSERLRILKVSSQLSELARGSLSREPEVQPEEPIMFVIATVNGLPLITEVLVPQAQVNELLIGGFLAAVNNFGKEIFSRSDILDRVMYENHTILFRVQNNLLFCYVYKGQTYTARKRLEQIMKEVKANSEVWDVLHRGSSIGIIPREIRKMVVRTVQKHLKTTSI